MSAKIIQFQPQRKSRKDVCAFQRAELGIILNLYGQMVSADIWKDYAIDMLPGKAIFSVYRRASEVPIYQITKQPHLRNVQGQYSVVAPGGLIMKRGHDLAVVLRVLYKIRDKHIR